MKSQKNVQEERFSEQNRRWNPCKICKEGWHHARYSNFSSLFKLKYCVFDLMLGVPMSTWP